MENLPTAQLSPPAGDSFDVRSTPPKPTSSAPIIDGYKDWRVLADRSFLYDKPNSKSRRIGEFKRGGMLSGRQDKAGWVRVVRPDQGYVVLSDLVEIYSN